MSGPVAFSLVCHGLLAIAYRLDARRAGRELDTREGICTAAAIGAGAGAMLAAVAVVGVNA